MVGAGPSRDTVATDALPSRRLAVLAQNAVVAVLGEDQRKNTDTLLTGYALLDVRERQGMPLLVCGLDPDHSRVLPEGAHALPHLPDAALGMLQRDCIATIHPALDAGFGLPVLDALAAGRPALVSDIPVLAELVPDAEARFDPRSPRSIAEVLKRLGDEGFVERQRATAAARAAPHSWSAVARRTIESHEAALARRPARRAGRARLAVITPLPPDRSGVATHERRRLAALAALADVDVLAERTDGPPPDSVDVAGLRVLDAAQVGPATAIEGYDVPVLHMLGNSHYHVAAWRHVMKHGGDVLLHDVRLVGLYGALLRDGVLDAASFERSVLRCEGARLPRDAATGTPIIPSYDECVAAGLLLCGEVVDRARLVLVHTDAARGLVLAERPGRAADVRVVPHGMLLAPPATSPRAAHEVASFGYLKDADRLAAMFSQLIRADPRIRGAMVGAAAVPGDEQRLRSQFERLGIASAVEVTGWVDERTWRRRLSSATVAVQVRQGWNGEASGSVIECLASGVPTIVDDVAAHEGVPHDAVVRVPQGLDPEALAEIVADLLADEARRDALATAGLAFARERSMPRAAAALLEALLSDRGPHAAATPGARDQ